MTNASTSAVTMTAFFGIWKFKIGQSQIWEMGCDSKRFSKKYLVSVTGKNIIQKRDTRLSPTNLWKRLSKVWVGFFILVFT
jgi:hypothetical protein